MRFFCACYMPLFFVCSGFTTPSNIDSVGLGRRIKKLLIAYFCISAILLLISSLYLLATGAANMGEKMAKSLFGILYSRFVIVEGQPHIMDIGNAPLWYLTCYIAVLLLFKIYSGFPVSYRRYPIGYLCFVMICLSVSFAVYYLPILLPWSLDAAFLGVCFFVCGIVYYKHNVLSCISFPVFLLLLSLYAALFLLNPGINMSVRRYGENGSLSAFAFVLIGCIGSLLWIKASQLIYQYIPWLGKLLASVGRSTLFILGFSNLCLKMQMVLESKIMTKNDIWCTGLLNAVNVIVSVALCCCLCFAWTSLRSRLSQRVGA